MAKRVLVFGSAGAGKTTVCNLLTNEKHEVHNGAQGCTFDTEEYRPVMKGGSTYVFFDTAGLNEGDNGKVPGPQAVRKLIKLIKQSELGFNLLVMVCRGRFLDVTGKNYEMFAKVFCRQEIPVLIVVTDIHTDRTVFVQQERRFYPADAADVKAGFFHTFDAPDMDYPFRALREGSVNDVWSAIERCALRTPVQIVSKDFGMVAVFRAVWTWLRQALNLPDAWAWVKGGVVELLQKLGFSQKDAALAAEEYNLL